MPESPEVLVEELLQLLPHCRVCDGSATRTMRSDVLLDNDEVGLFCDEHGAADSERFHNLTQMTYEDLEQAGLVRRCLSLRRCSSAVLECAYHAAAEGLCMVVNARMNQNLKEGSTWVRVKPPSREELEAISGGAPRLMPFCRVGSLATLVSLYYLVDETRMVDVKIGGDTVVYEFEAFIRAYVRAVAEGEWQLDKLSAFQ
jgi:hypothetical protein